MNTKDVKKTAFMKKNIENNVNENMNVVENNTVENIVMDEETMQAIVDDNIDIVPRSQRKKFEAMTLKQKVAKIKFYNDMKIMREDARIKNSLPNKVKEMFERRKGTVQDAKDLINWLNVFVEGFREREIARIDEEIAKLEEIKLSL